MCNLGNLNRGFVKRWHRDRSIPQPVLESISQEAEYNFVRFWMIPPFLKLSLFVGSFHHHAWIFILVTTLIHSSLYLESVLKLLGVLME